MTNDPMVLTPTEGSSGAWADVGAGVYPSHVALIEDAGISEMYPADGPRFKFTFALDGLADENGEQVSLFKWCSQKLSTGEKPSNLTKWATAMGLAPVKGVPFAVSQLMGRPCQVVVEIKYPGTDKQKPDITSILPAASGATRAAAPPVQAAPVAAADVCKVEGCGGAVAKYTGRGTPLCDAHTIEDLV